MWQRCVIRVILVPPERSGRTVLVCASRSVADAPSPTLCAPPREARSRRVVANALTEETQCGAKRATVPQFFLDLVQLSERRGTHHVCRGRKLEVAKGAARGNAVAGGRGHQPFRASRFLVSGAVDARLSRRVRCHLCPRRHPVLRLSSRLVSAD